MQVIVIWPFRSGAKPEIPRECFGRRLFLNRPRVNAPTFANPGVNFFDLADRTGLDQFDDAAVIVAGVDLRSHLRRELFVGRNLGQHPRFGHRVGEWFFAVHMLALLHRPVRGRGMCVVRGAHHHGVDLLEFKQFAKIDKRLSFGKVGLHLVQVLAIDIAYRRDGFVLNAGNVRRAHDSRADDAEANLFVGRGAFGSAEAAMHAQPQQAEAGRSGLEKSTAGNLSIHEGFLRWGVHFSPGQRPGELMLVSNGLL